MVEGFRSDINGLRAVAVLSVFAYHLGLPLPGGFAGVDIFFVISGYLISGHIITSLSEQRFSITDFYVRRARRILPAYFVVSVATAILAFYFLLPSELVEFSKSLMASATFIPNIYFFLTSNYFSPAAEQMPLLHYWSLGVEEQFYFVLPAILFLVSRAGRLAIPATVVLLMTVSLAASVVFTRENASAAFYLLPFRAFELLIGTIVALPQVRRTAPWWLAFSVATLGLVAVIASLFLVTSSLPLPGLWSLPVCVGTAAIIWSGGGAKTHFHKLLGLPGLAFFGRISYSLYLVHWPAIVFGGRMFSAVDPMILKLGIVGASFVAASAMYFVVEQPFRSFKLLSRRPLVAIYSAVFLAIPLAAGWYVQDQKGFPRQSGDPVARIAEAAAYLPDPNFRKGVCFWEDAAVSDIDATPCLPPKTTKSVVIWGDSTGAQYYQGLKAVLEPRGYYVGQLTASACPSILDYDAANRPYCRAFNDFAFQQIVEREPDIVILAGSWDYGQDARVKATIDRLVGAGRRVVVLGQALAFSQPVPQLLLGRIKSGNPSTMSDADLKKSVRRKDSDIRPLVTSPSAMFVSMLDLMCPNGNCPLTEPDGALIYFDDVHVTPVGSRSAAEALATKIFAGDFANSVAAGKADYVAQNEAFPAAKTWDFAVGRNFDVKVQATLADKQPAYATLFAATNGPGSGFSFEMDTPGMYKLFVWTETGAVSSPAIAVSDGQKHVFRLTSQAGAIALSLDGVQVFTSPGVPKPSDAPFRNGMAVFGGRNARWVVDEVVVSGDMIPITGPH